MMNFGREFTARIKREPWITEFDQKKKKLSHGRANTINEYLNLGSPDPLANTTNESVGYM
jgi:hypothetical protein